MEEFSLGDVWVSVVDETEVNDCCWVGLAGPDLEGHCTQFSMHLEEAEARRLAQAILAPFGQKGRASSS